MIIKHFSKSDKLLLAIFSTRALNFSRTFDKLYFPPLRFIILYTNWSHNFLHPISHAINTLSNPSDKNKLARIYANRNFASSVTRYTP